MKIRLGYVGICNTLNLTSSKTITYSNYNKLDEGDKLKKANDIILENFYNLKQILIFNIRNNIKFFRMTSNLIPLSTHPKVNIDFVNLYSKEFLEIGQIINDNDLRVDTHPDQFCVLNSTRKEVVESSINILKYHQKMLEAMKIDGKMIIHVGSSTFGKENSLKRFENNFKKLDKKLQKMIIIENDDKIFNMVDVLNLCQRLKVPMVLDIHHHKCNNNGEKIEDYIKAIFDTWSCEKLNPKVHISSSKSSKEIRSHNEYIDINDFDNFIESVKFTNTSFDMMIEAKAKDEALFRLLRVIKYENKYKVDKNEIFIK